jgi:nucleoside-diphosphate-sugar epimerase
MDEVTLPPLPTSDLEDVLTATADLWRAQPQARFFITGGTGFFGRWLLESLLGANQKFGLAVHATVLSRDPAAFLARAPHLRQAPGLRWIKGSVAEFEAAQVARSLQVPLGRLCFDAVIHLATEADNAQTVADPLSAFDAIAGSTRRALEFAALVGTRRFLFTSSGSGYGLQPAALAKLAEDFTGAPDGTDLTSAYAISGSAKRAAEALCATFGKSHGLETVIARCFAFSGPGLPLDGKFALGNFLADALAGRDIVVQGDGTPVRSYLYASDLATWLWTLLARGAPGRPYNVGSEQAVTIRETAEAVRRELAPAAKVRILTEPDASRPVHQYVPNTGRAREELGLRETVDLASAIRRTAGWLRRVS